MPQSIHHVPIRPSIGSLVDMHKERCTFRVEPFNQPHELLRILVGGDDVRQIHGLFGGGAH
jgi:hypothetical protein